MEQLSQQADFWDDAQRATQLLKQLNDLGSPRRMLADLERRLGDCQVAMELGAEAQDESLQREAEQLCDDLLRDLSALELDLMLNGQYDKANAILALHAGAGGTEAQDWTAMLYRMYLRWADAKGYRVETLDLLPGDEAGIKSVTFEVFGSHTYGYLKAEKGVHRLVRISPFDASGRRHTSFASLDVLPEIEADNEIEIRPEDLKVDTFRASGAGGQHVNKTESAIRITHLPTGIVVGCQTERSQFSNRETAMRILRARLLEQREAEQRRQVGELRGDQGEIAWGNQIRSYVFQPYTMVKDHRTNVETSNVQAVMDGAIDPFIEAYLRWQRPSARM